MCELHASLAVLPIIRVRFCQKWLLCHNTHPNIYPQNEHRHQRLSALRKLTILNRLFQSLEVTPEIIIKYSSQLNVK